MKKLRFLDETLRDGQQTLWATRMKTSAMLPIAPVMDRAGFYQICAMAPVSFETAAVYLHEDPWERLRLLRRYIPHTQLDFLVRSRNVVGWQRQPNDVVELFFETLRRIGIDSIKVFDGLNDFRNVEWHIKIAKRLGFQVKALQSFCVSPVHTDAYLAGKARELRDLGVDAVIQSDAAGVMPPDRVRTLIPALRAAIGGGIELQFAAHATTGLATACYREAIRQGVDVVWTSSRALAYRSSIPATIDVLRIAREEGRETDLDERSVREIDDWFYWVAHQEKRPVPEPVRFDPEFYERYAAHQIPGGMISNLVSQLRDMGIEDRLDDVLDEAARVRAELGYPVMVTPFSQFVGVQATLNVIEGRRYASVPEGIRLYARGYYGRPVAPLDPNVLDRLMGDDPPIDPMEGMDEPILPRVRAEHGPFASDEDLLLFLFLNPAALSDFRKNRRPITWDPVRSPMTALIREMAGRRELASVEVRRGRLKLAVSRAAVPQGARSADVCGAAAGAGPETGAETGADTGPDTGPDAAPETGPEAAPETGAETRPESGPEAGQDAGQETGPEGLAITPSDAARLLEAADGHRIRELRLKTGAFRLTALSPQYPAGAPSPGQTAGSSAVIGRTPERPSGAGQPGRSARADVPNGEVPALVPVLAPRVGTFRRAGQPLGGPCVEVGTLVTENAAVGYIETVDGAAAVAAGSPGRIVEVCAEDGAFVEYGQRLFLLEPRALP